MAQQPQVNVGMVSENGCILHSYIHYSSAVCHVEDTTVIKSSQVAFVFQYSICWSEVVSSR